MAFGKNGDGVGFKTEKRFVGGHGIVIDLDNALPHKYDETLLGAGTLKGFVATGTVVCVFGAKEGAPASVVGETVSILVRPDSIRTAIFNDLEKTREGSRFLLEGITGNTDALEARWAHGAGENRSIKELEIVGPPNVLFENPNKDDGPKHGWLSLNLDGSPTTFSTRDNDGGFKKHSWPYDDVVGRLRISLDKNLKFRVNQHVLSPSEALMVDNQHELEVVLTAFRDSGFTDCVVRSFVPGTTDSNQVDVQVLYWPADVPADDTFNGVTYDMPTLQDTKRFAALRDGEAAAHMEVIPGYTVNLIGNQDVTKSTKHRFVNDVVNGLSDKQKSMYGAQNYGAGISVCAVGENGEVSGLTRLAIRTGDVQYRRLMNIPTPHFVDAAKIKMTSAA